MEVGTFLRAAVRRWWIAVLIAVLAGGVTYLVTRNTADSYDGSVTLTVPTTAASTTGSNGQWVENFSTALTTPDVINEIAKDTGASPSDLTAGLSASQVNNSSFIDITYNSVDEARARSVVVSAAKRTAAYLSRSTVNDAQTAKDSTTSALNAAIGSLDAAQSAVNAFVSKNGPSDPNNALQIAANQLSQLTSQRAQAISAKHSTSAFDTIIAQDRAAVAKYQPLARQYTTLNNNLTSAQDNASTARKSASAADTTLATAQEAPLIGDTSATLVTGSSTMLKAVAIAGGIGLVLGVALALLVTALRRNKPSRRSRRRAAAHQASGAAATDDDADGAAASAAVSETRQLTTLKKITRNGPSPSSPDHDDEYQNV